MCLYKTYIYCCKYMQSFWNDIKETILFLGVGENSTFLNIFLCFHNLENTLNTFVNYMMKEAKENYYK